MPDVMLTNPADIEKLIAKLNSKAARQATALHETQWELNYWKQQLNTKVAK